MNDGLFVRRGAITQPFIGLRRAVPEGLTMNLRVTVTIKIEIAVKAFGLAALLILLS